MQTKGFLISDPEAERANWIVFAKLKKITTEMVFFDTTKKNLGITEHVLRITYILHRSGSYPGVISVIHKVHNTQGHVNIFLPKFS